MSNEKFFNFPIQLLQDAPDMSKVGNNILDYAMYAHAQMLAGSIDVRMKAAVKFFGFESTSPDVIAEWTVNGQHLHNSLPEKCPMTGINKDLLFSFYKGDQSLTEIAVLVAHLAIKSILGKKSFCRITSDFLLCRMAGYPSIKEMNGRPNYLNHGLPDYLKPYATRRRMDNIKSELQRSYGVKVYGRYTRGIFVTEKLSLEELIKEVETKRKKYWQAKQKNDLSTAVTKVLKELYQ